MVISRLFRKSAPAPVIEPPRLPAGLRVYAIGDIHGRRDCFDDLLATIERDSATATGDVQLILLGDLIDRGPDSRGVVERAMALAAAGRGVEAAPMRGRGRPRKDSGKPRGNE